MKSTLLGYVRFPDRPPLALVATQSGKIEWRTKDSRTREMAELIAPARDWTPDKCNPTAWALNAVVANIGGTSRVVVDNAGPVTEENHAIVS